MVLTACTESHGKEGSNAPSDQSLPSRDAAVLRVECITGRTIKRFLFTQFWLRWLAFGVWIVFSVFSFQRSFYFEREKMNLHLATILSTIFLCVSCTALYYLVHHILKVVREQQTWTTQRRRLVGIYLVQLVSMTGASSTFAASSAVASKNHCNTIATFCRWSFFIQWTCFNMIICSQVLLTHSACVWTDSSGKAQRRLFAHLLPGMADKPKNKLILEAPWLIHLPKFVLGAIAQATIFVQLVLSLQGGLYIPYEGSCAQPILACQYSRANAIAAFMRMSVYGIFLLWHFVLVFQGMRDMASMPVDAFRMGRMLIRMVCSRDLGLGSNIVPYTTLLVASLTNACPSCQPNYVLLGLIVQSSTLMSMGSYLMHPLSRSTEDDIVMQVWLQRFAWTEHHLESRIRARNRLPLDRLVLRKEPMFCFETAVKLLYWCGFVYEHEEELTQQSSEDVAMGLYKLEHMQLFRDPLTSTKCLVAWGQDTCVVAFRGTANKQNAVYDVKAWLVPQETEETESIGCGMGSIAAVHSGFRTSWQTGLKQAVCDALRQAVKHSTQRASQMRMLVTGHSLGGVMAVLAAYDIADLFDWQSVEVYTVGAPRPGNKAFSAKYNARVPSTWHIINPRDPVPAVGKFGVLYSRPGQRVLVDQKGNLQVRPSPLDIRLSSANPVAQLLDDFPLVSRLWHLVRGVKQHLLGAYRNSLVNTLKAELKQPRFEEGLEGVLELADSISFTEVLQAADLDVAAKDDASNKAGAALRAAGSIVADAASVV